MCGITGFFKKPGSHVSLKISKTLSHRGPDDNGYKIFNDNLIGLFHTRLSILDLSALGHQPMSNDYEKFSIVFNGEIYNYLELKKELELLGYKFKSTSDTEVLLNLYISVRCDEDAFIKMLNRLNGIFAFAIWDEDKEELIIVRDGVGVKPLYYIQNEVGFSFASELKALDINCDKNNNNCRIEDSLNIQAINRYLTFLWNPDESTPTKEVKKLEPGTAIWIKKGVVQKQVKWYDLPVNRSVNLINNNSSVEQLITATQNHLKASVQRQMIADVPVGAFLSGGLDSSAIVTFARQINPDIKCFTIEAIGQNKDGATDDLPFAKRVAKHLGVQLDVVQVDSSKMALDLEAMVEQLDEPLADPASLNVVYISKLARQKGIKVLLSGAGGDDLFSGYRRHRALMAEGLWSWMPQSLRTLLHDFTGQLDQRSPFNRRISKLFAGAHLNGDERLVNYFRWNSEQDLKALYSEEFKFRLGNSKAEQPMLDFLSTLPENTSKLEEILALEQRFFLTDHNLIYTDKMSMAVGVEVRVPFLDLELVEFAATIPAKYKQRGAEGKWILKKAMEPYLPKDVIYRPKTGFGAPLRSWIRFELRDLVSDLLGPISIQNRGIFNPVAVQQLINDNDSGKKDAAYTIFSMMCIEIWCRKFLDNRAYTNKFA